jgi:DNA-binding MarR family transcriptional regulator
MESRGKIDQRVLGDPGTAAFSVSYYPFYQLNRVVSRYTGVIEARLRDIGLDVPGWRVLMILGERAPRRIGEIAQDAVIPVSTMTRIIGRMARAGLVRHGSRDGDARVRDVFLTDAGAAMLVRARAVTAPVYAGAIEGFSEAEFVRLLGLLARMHDNLGTLD